MSKSVFNIILLCLSCSLLRAQLNLVPNCSFEEYNNCPSQIEGSYIDASVHWTSQSGGSPDYFNACSTEQSLGTYMFSVPQNYEGYQHARTGNAYGGYYAALTPGDNNYYEYLSVKLVSPLEASKTYRLTYYLSLADSFYRYPNSLQFINHSGALFSNFLYTSSGGGLIPQTPQIVSDPSVFLNDSTGWQKIEGFYTATGGEEFLTIGYFCLYDDIAYNYLPSAQSDSAIAAYYYIDDVSLEEYDVLLLIPNIITPNGDGINDFFIFNNDLVQAEEIIILNRWGNIVFQSTSSFLWDGYTQKGLECSAGTYFYIIRTKTREINGFTSLIR